MMNTRNFDTQRYERCLSTFGKQVLGNLVKNVVQRNESYKVNVRSRYNYGQNKRVLNFGDSYYSPSATSCDQNVPIKKSHNNIVDDKSGSTAPQDVTLPVTTFQALLKTATEVNVIGLEDELIALKKDADTHSETLLNPLFGTANNENSNKFFPDTPEADDHIEWDDIFDTQLLNDLNDLDTHSNNNAQQEITVKSNTVDSCVEYKDDIDNTNIRDKTTTLDRTMKKNKSKDVLNLPSVEQETNGLFYNNNNNECNMSENLSIKEGKTKRVSSNKISNDTPKKAKAPAADLQKKTFRKQTYTKAVKTWLSNVEHENFQKDNSIDLQINKDTKAGEIIPESSNSVKKNKKKSVQAQLTNKDGVMKFGKPKQNEPAEKPKVLDSTTNSVSVEITVKEKKVKSKFVAPIKSQIPVRDISYDIVQLNDDSYEQYVTELNAINDQEINMTLTFSNGFCQLNSQYTADTCVADGVMFEVNTIIYYWKHIYKTYCGTMGKLISNNTMVCCDGKNLLKYFTAQCDINVVSTEVKVFDLQIGGNLLEPSNPADSFTDVQKLVSCIPEYTVATHCVQQKCAWYLTVLRDCFARLRALLVDYQLWNVFVDIEMPVLPIVAEMERVGVCVDSERLKAMESLLERRLQATERACHAAAGRVFQVNSATQVRAILYDDLKLDVKGNVRIRETLCKGDKSTSEAMLRSLMAVHPLPRLILEYRHVHKAHATFVAGIANQVKDGVIKPTWEQTAAVTGRIACNNPNLQAIPKTPFSLVLFPAETKEEELLMESNETLNFRSVYVPREGRVLLAADFKHIECRVFAYAAADTSLLDALASPDLFRVLASRWLQKPLGQVSSEDRERTKRIVYASLYGAGVRRLADLLGLGYDQTLSVVASFNRTFPSLKSFGRGVVARCERGAGRLATLCGRARTFPNIFSGDSTLRAQAERQAINFIVQGSAADLCKLAMVCAARRLRARATLLLQIHDELVWEVRPQHLPQVAAEIKSAMEGIGEGCRVSVPLPVALSVGRHWGAMEDYCPPYPPT